MKKTREFQKNIYVCFIDYAKAFDCVDHKKLGCAFDYRQKVMLGGGGCHFKSTWTENFQSSSWFQKRHRNQRSNCQHLLDHGENKGIPEKYLLLLHWSCYSLFVDHNKLWKILKEMGIPDHLPCLLRNLYVGQEATVRTRHGTTDWFKLGKENDKAVYCHPAYLTYMQSTSCKMPGWMKHKLDQDFQEKYQ